MAHSESTAPPENTVGALIFTAYVAAALLVTGIISRNLLQAYSSSRRSRHAGKVSLDTALLTFVSLSVLSFAVLSYHMLSFLMTSYCAWAQQQGVSLAGGSLGYNDIWKVATGAGEAKILIWEWLTMSTLFEDFARAICDEWARYWWTSQALVVTMRVGVWMAREGPRHRIPHLWAYFAIAQILPISFAHNLFCIALLLSSPPSPVSRPKTAKSHSSTKATAVSIIQLHTIRIALFYILLLFIPISNHTPFFIPAVFAIRLLLLSPLFLPPYESSQLEGNVALLPFVVSLLGWQGLEPEFSLRDSKDVGKWMNGFGEGLKRLMGALDGNHATMALGWDWIICVASEGVWWATGSRDTGRLRERG